MIHGEILIISDDKLSLTLLSEILTNAGYTVQTADNGELALCNVEAKLPALILLDVLLSGIDGYEVCRRLKDSDDTKDIPVIFTGSKTNPVDKVKAFNIGGVDHISKPFEVDEVLARVATHLSIREAKKEIDEKNLQLQQDIDELEQVKDALKESEKRFRTTFGQAPLGIAIVDSLTGHIYEVNPMFAEIAGRTRDEMATINWMSITHPDDIQDNLDNMSLLNAGKIDNFQIDKRCIRPDGAIIWINMIITPIKVENKSHPRHLCVIEDITKRKQTEQNQMMMTEILSILNDPISLTDTTNNIINIIKREMGFEAVGMRLQEGYDYPYLVQDGFDEDFLIKENTLVDLTDDGSVYRDENNNVTLQGACGMVISGRTDPDDPNFTPYGSWWTNDSVPLLNLPPILDSRRNPRNLCIREGYNSIALIPIRSNQKIVGLLQFNDRRKNRFTPEMIHFFEEVSANIGVALMRKQVVNVLEKHAFELELNKKRIDALLKLTQMTDSSLEEISNFVIKKGVDLTNSDFGFIGAVNEDETDLTIYAWSKHVMDACGLSDEQPMFYVKDGGLWIEPLLQRKSVVINDYESTEFNKDGVPYGHIPLKRLINVPIFEGERIVALVTMANKEEEYDETDVHQLKLLLDGMWTILKRKDAEEKYRTLFNSSSDAIMLLDKNGFIDCNPATLSVFAYNNADEFIGLHPADVSPQFQPDGTDSKTAANDKIEDAFENGHADFEWIHTRKDGSDFQTDVTLTAFMHGDKKILQATVRDITQRKQDEESLKRYAEDLEHSNELKSLFGDIMRHDLLNPAGVVAGYTEMLYDMEDDEQKIDFLQKIEISNKKLINLIENTAKFAKLESVDDLEFSDENIAAMFKMVVDNFRPQIEDKQITLEFKAEGTYLANVSLMIEEVFVNLLSNAIKYSPEKSKIVVDITDAGDDWRVSVTDQGEGVSDENKPLLFDRFQRVNKVAVKGSGLGLAIVKRIIELHEGDFGVDDNPDGVGSVFWVTVKKSN